MLLCVCLYGVRGGGVVCGCCVKATTREAREANNVRLVVFLFSLCQETLSPRSSYTTITRPRVALFRIGRRDRRVDAGGKKAPPDT